MRDTDPKQDAPALGKKIEQPKMPEQHKHIGNGVWKKPDGSFETAIPVPPPRPH
jgi:hypothetical protein